MDKLYIITRRDLKPGQQACQGMHAMRLFAERYPDREMTWYIKSNHLCFVSVAFEANLIHYNWRAHQLGIPSVIFTEPDLGDQATAVAMAPEGSSLLSGLPLALREY